MADARLKILNAASDLFLEGGAAKMSVRAISRKAGLSTIGIYSYFKGKQGILDALYIDGVNMLFDAINAESSERGTLESVLSGAKGYLKMARDNQAHYRLVFGAVCDDGYEPSEEARAEGEKLYNQLVEIHAEYIKVAGLKIDPVQATLDIWALLHGYVSISHHTGFDQNLDWSQMALDSIKTHLGAWRDSVS